VAGEAEIDTRKVAPVVGIPPRTPAEWRKDFFSGTVLALLALALYLIPVFFNRPLVTPDEAAIAVRARDILQSGNWCLASSTGTVRDVQPPLPEWMAALAAKGIGGGQTTQLILTRATLLVPALMAALAVLIVTLYGSAVFGRNGGTIAGAMLAYCFGVAGAAQHGGTDAILLASCTLMFCSAAWIVTHPRPGFFALLWLSLTVGAGILTKGHVALLLLLPPVLIEAFKRGRFNGRKVLIFVLGLAIGIGIAAPWYLTLCKNHPAACQQLIENALSGLNPSVTNRPDRWLYYFYSLPLMLLPWTPMLMMGLIIYRAKIRRGEAMDTSGLAALSTDNLRFFGIAALVGFVGLYIAGTQRACFLIPLLPTVTLAAGCMLSRFNFTGGVAEEDMAWSQIGIGVLFALVVWVLPFVPDLVPQASAIAIVIPRTGWIYCVPIGLLVIVLHMVSARQWVEGNPRSGVLVIAGFAYLLIAGLSIYEVLHADERLVAKRESESMRAVLEADHKGARVYAVDTGANITPAVLSFYLEQPVLTLSDLENETASTTPTAIDSRVWIVRKQDIRKLEELYGMTFGDVVRRGNDELILYRLPADRDWPALVKKVRAQAK